MDPHAASYVVAVIRLHFEVYHFSCCFEDDVKLDRPVMYGGEHVLDVHILYVFNFKTNHAFDDLNAQVLVVAHNLGKD